MYCPPDSLVACATRMRETNADLSVLALVYDTNYINHSFSGLGELVHARSETRQLYHPIATVCKTNWIC